MAIRATRRVAHHHHSAFKHSEADETLLAVVSSKVFHFEVRPSEDEGRVRKIQASRLQRVRSLLGVKGDGHKG